MEDQTEKLYVDLDDSEFWCVWGEDSGKCYAQYYTEKEANDALERRQGLGRWNPSQLLKKEPIK